MRSTRGRVRGVVRRRHRSESRKLKATDLDDHLEPLTHVCAQPKTRARFDGADSMKRRLDRLFCSTNLPQSVFDKSVMRNGTQWHVFVIIHCRNVEFQRALT